MTQRDIAKDKDTLRLLMRREARIDAILIAQHWIAQYEAAQARITELEALLHPNNRPDVVTRLGHDTALETVFRELEGKR